MRFRRSVAVALVVVLGLLVPACSTREGERLGIATGGTGGVYFVLGGGLAELIGEHVDGYEATAEVTSASVDNMLLIADGKTDIAFALADTAADGVQGRDSFDGEKIPAMALASVYLNYTQLVTTAGSGIRTVEDLRGKKVSVGSPGSGTEVIALRVLEAAGLDPAEDIAKRQLGAGESVQAVKDGALDAFFWSGGVPTGAVTDLATTDEVVMVPTEPQLATLQQRYGDVYAKAEIEAGEYEGVDEPVATIAVPNYLVVREDMDAELAYQLTKLLFERKDDLAAVHPSAKSLDKAKAQEVAPLRLHPGAERYYKEAGGDGG
jgi:TRAP transporter TAXI family solute receptor